MNLSEALTHISAKKYYTICGYTYRNHTHYGHGKLTFKELSPEMQHGVMVLLYATYRIQKMIYSYDMDFVRHSMADCGIKLKPFFDSCDISPSFYRTMSLSLDREERLVKVRLQLMKMVNRLFEYVLE